MSQQSRKIIFAVVVIILVIVAGGFAVAASHPPITVTSTTTQTIATTTTDQQILQETSTVTSTSMVYSNTVATITMTQTLVAETFQNGTVLSIESIPYVNTILNYSNVAFGYTTHQCIADNFSSQCQQPQINSITVFYNGTNESVNLSGSSSGYIPTTEHGYPFGAKLAVLVTGVLNNTAFSQWFNVVNPASCDLCVVPVLLVIG